MSKPYPDQFKLAPGTSPDGITNYLLLRDNDVGCILMETKSNMGAQEYLEAITASVLVTGNALRGAHERTYN